MSETVIAIDRVPLAVVAAASPDRAERVSRRVRDAVVRALPAALASACGRELDEDDAYVFIDRLDVQCAVATHWTDDAIAARFAERIARALLLARTLGAALVFRDRAEFLSAFLAAAAGGEPFARWCFGELDGLAPLPASARIRTLVIAEGAVAWEALARLSPDSLCRVLRTVDASDAERMLAGITTDASNDAASARALIAALDAAAAVSLPSASHAVIASLIHVVRAGTGTASARNLAAIRVITSLAGAARGGRLPGIPSDACPATVLAWCHAAGVHGAQRAVALELDAGALAAYIVSQMPERAEAQTTAVSDAAFDFTPFGGALLLCIVLVRAGWWAAWRDALRTAGLEERADPLSAWIALAVVARALSPERPSAVEGDPALQRAFGVPNDPRPVAADRATKRLLRQALAAAAPLMHVASRRRRLGPLLRRGARALLADAGRRIPGCDRATAAYLRSQCLALPAAVRADGGAARLGRAPLDVLLVFSGLKRASVTLPDGRVFSLAEETSL